MSGAVAVVLMIIGIADGRPAQTLERAWPVPAMTIGSDDRACRQAIERAKAVVEPLRARSPEIIVSYRCQVELAP